MKKRYLLVLFATLFAISCGSSTATNDEDDDDNPTTDTGIKVVGSLSGTAPSISSSIKSISAFKGGEDGGCPNGNVNAISVAFSPSAYTVALKRFVLLGDTGTDDFEVFATDDPEEAYIADFANDTEFFSDTETYPPAGTYNGIEIELFYADATFPLVIPAIDADEADYNTRNFFYDIGDALVRDVAIEHADEWNWISREDWSVAPFSGDRPVNVLDLWSSEAFWERDPITISTENSSEFGLNFNFDGDPLVIPENPDGLYQIEMAFNVANTFTYWEYLEHDSLDDADNKFTVGEDCGYRIMFPPVTITMTEEAAAAE